jgi:hypothetical protein
MAVATWLRLLRESSEYHSKRGKMRPAGLLPPGCAGDLWRSFTLKHANHRLGFLNAVSDNEALTAVSHYPHHTSRRSKPCLASVSRHVAELTGGVAPRVWAGEARGLVTRNLQLIFHTAIHQNELTSIVTYYARQCS